MHPSLQSNTKGVFAALAWLFLTFGVTVWGQGNAPDESPKDTKPAEIPQVELTKQHDDLCARRAGDNTPKLSLATGGNATIELPAALGSRATVLLFWSENGWMSRMLLADLLPDFVEPFGDKGVKFFAIAVGRQSHDASQFIPNDLRERLTSHAAISWAADAEGNAFAAFGKSLLPRVYVLDANGTIRWFDIEYSESTRRELTQTLGALTTLQE